MNPAEHSARADAERHSTIVGGEVDRDDHAIIDKLRTDPISDDEACGAWANGERIGALGREGRVMVDLFAGGGGGWDLAARSLDMPSVGIEWDAPSCSTRAVVGLATIRADVSTYPAERFAGKVEGLCGSPPCQSFSSAGKGAGLADPRGQMVYEPMRYVRAIRPRWVALEQVPEVLGYWRWIAGELRTMGYGTWCGILNAADYGVPQIRKRAILLASRDRQAVPPAPTHSRHGHADLFDGGLAKWVTMAEALGWGLTERPAYVVAGGGAEGSGGSAGSRQREEIAKHRAAGKWRVNTNQGSRIGAGKTERFTREVDRPAPTVTGGAATQWCWERPSTTICASNPGVVNPGGGPNVSMSERGYLPIGPNWSHERPATTIQADPRIAPPGHHEHNRDATAIRVTVAELGVLQGFPADHPWQAPRVSAQIGNAIPPPLALACLRSITGAAA